MSENTKPITDSPSARAWSVIDRQVALGRAVREKARALLQNAQFGTTRDGYICVRKGDFEDLSIALDDEADFNVR